jgi:hypothetical protein
MTHGQKYSKGFILWERATPLTCDDSQPTIDEIKEANTGGTYCGADSGEPKIAPNTEPPVVTSEGAV